MQYPLRTSVEQLSVNSLSTKENKLILQVNQAAGADVAPALRLTYYPSHKFFEAVWQRPVSSQEYCQAIRFVGLCIAVLRAEYVLVDFSKMGAPTEEDEKTTALFLQKALSNTTLKRSARLLGTSQEQERSYKAVTDNSPVLPYEVQVFYSVTEAKQWLFSTSESQPSNLEKGIWIPLTCSLRALKSMAGAGKIDAVLQSKNTRITEYADDYAEIITDEEKSLIILRWLRKVDSREHRYGILKAGKVLLEKNIRFAILNQQRLGVLTLEEQAWLATQSAQIISQSELERLAIINSIDVIQQMASDKINLRIRKQYNNYLSEYFLDENDAMYWLFSHV